ncbi:uncharacterized protein LOC130736530 [Lotus japonicus]|uniref:uncharacterized protein LOC130736530 n=1 Tax=Lotus japonicus TaxID=34305 RepID=UPI00258A0B47|nr:uncharacterized protein LOC130736530 [Lotus japonicus]
MVGNNTGDFRPCKNQDKITFKFETKVIPVSVEKVPVNLFKFADFEEILSPSFDQQILVDVIGSLTAIGTEVEFSRNGVPTKRIQIEITSGGPHTKCVLFGEYVEELNAFLQAGNISNVVVVLLLAKLRTFKEKLNCKMHSIAANYCSTWIIPMLFVCEKSFAIIQKSAKDVEANVVKGGDKLSIPQEIRDIMHKQLLFKVEAKEDFGGRFESTYTVKKICKDADIIMKFIHNEASGSDISVIVLKSPTERTIFIIYATIKKIESTNDWYKLLLNVADDTGSTTFTTGSMEHPPQEIVDLVHKKFLFKVEGKDICGRWFNPAFNVLKICKDQQIISKFKTTTITKNVKRNTPTPILEDSNTPIKRRSYEGSITEVVGNENGILTVSVEGISITTGIKNEITINNETERLSAKEIRRMIQEAENYEVDDMEFKKNMKAMNALDRYLYKMSKHMKDKCVSSKLPPIVQDKINSAIVKGQDLLDDDQQQETIVYVEFLREVKSIFIPDSTPPPAKSIAKRTWGKLKKLSLFNFFGT